MEIEEIDEEVLFETLTGRAGEIGVITLNRPAALNALNYTMIKKIYAKLLAWQEAKAIKAVVIRAVPGRAFCAGGDLKLTYDYQQKKDPLLQAFFRDEYRLNHLIYHFPKPYIAFLDGITMGGGAGISIHGSHRIGTDNLLFAMPETGIGYFPDVGGSYFLSRLPNAFGIYLGLTGARLSCDEVILSGLVQFKARSNSLTPLLVALTEQSFGSNPHQVVTDVLSQFQISLSSINIKNDQDEMARCSSKMTVEEIEASLEASNSDFCQKVLLVLRSKSPTSLKVTLHALQQGQSLSFDDCMRQEYRLATRFIFNHDFHEGIRAVAIDKDNQPHWQPNTLNQLSKKNVLQYFEPLTEELY